MIRDCPADGLRTDFSVLRIHNQDATTIGPDGFEGEIENALQQLIEWQGRLDRFFGKAIQHLQISLLLRGIGDPARYRIMRDAADDAGAVGGIMLLQQSHALGDILRIARRQTLGEQQDRAADLNLIAADERL